MSKPTKQTEPEPVRETCRDCGGDNDRYPVFPYCVACWVRLRAPGVVLRYMAVQQVDGHVVPDFEMRKTMEWEDDGRGGMYCEKSMNLRSFPDLSAARARVAELNREGSDDGPDGLYEGKDVSRWVVATVGPPEGGKEAADA